MASMTPEKHQPQPHHHLELGVSPDGSYNPASAMAELLLLKVLPPEDNTETSDNN